MLSLLIVLFNTRFKKKQRLTWRWTVSIQTEMNWVDPLTGISWNFFFKKIFFLIFWCLSFFFCLIFAVKVWEKIERKKKATFFLYKCLICLLFLLNCQKMVMQRLPTVPPAYIGNAYLGKWINTCFISSERTIVKTNLIPCGTKKAVRRSTFNISARKVSLVIHW